MSSARTMFLSSVAGALLFAAQPAPAQRMLGLAPAEGVAELAKEVGKRFTFVCPASDGKRASVYGTDVYTADSGVCAAAIHAGVLRPGVAGIVSLVIGSGAESFVSSTRNGVTTKSYGRWGTSYTFARDNARGQIGWRTVWNGVPADFTEPVAVECPANGTLNGGVLWGTDVYTKDSTICLAAVHAGLIKAETGGGVIVRRVPGLNEYAATNRFGIASQRYGAYGDAFSVTAAGRAVAERSRSGVAGVAAPATEPATLSSAPNATASGLRAARETPQLDQSAIANDPPPASSTSSDQAFIATAGQEPTRALSAVQPTTPTATVPTGFSARVLGAGGTGGAVSLSWQPVTGALKYRFEGPGIVPAGHVVPASSSGVTLNSVPAGPATWRMAAVYENDYYDPSKMASASAVVRFLPTKSMPWLSKYGQGNAGTAMQHRLGICTTCVPGSTWDTLITQLGGLGARLGVDCADGFGLASTSYGDCGEASYVNVTDLGTARATSCFALGLGGTICYTTGADNGRTVIVRRNGATVFLAYRPPVAGGQHTLTDTVTVDSEGPKFLPNVCLSCHGGTQAATGVVTNSTLLPLDPSLLQIGTVTTFELGTHYPNVRPSQWVEQHLVRPLNRVVVQNGSPAVGRYLRWIYGNNLDASPNLDAVPPGWASQATLYRQVIKPYCVMCHLGSTSTVDFSSFDNVVRDKARIHAAVCTARSMPHAEIPFKAFWTKDTGQMFLPGLFAATLGYQSCP